MEEPEKRDASRGVSESTVTVGEHAVAENLVDSEVSISKGQVDDSLTEEVERVEGSDGACNGEDIMVEVLGSDVYVDGVCTNRTVEDLDEVDSGVSTDNGSSLERDEKSPGVDVCTISEPVFGASGEEVDEGVCSTIEGVSGVDESIEKVSEEIAEGSERAADAMVLDSEAKLDDSLVVACPMDTETEAEAIHVEKEDDETEETMDVKMSKLESDQDGTLHNGSDNEVLNAEESQKVEVHPAQTKDLTADEGAGHDSVHGGGESQLVTQDASVTEGGGDEALEEGQLQEHVEEGVQVVDAGVETPADMETVHLGISDADVGNPGMKNSSSSADGNENSNLLGQDVIEKAPDDISHSDSSEKTVSNLEGDGSSIIEAEHEDPGNHMDDQSKIDEGPKSVEEREGAVQALNSKNLDPTVAVPKDVASTNSQSSSQSNQMNAEEDVAAANDSTIFTPNIEASTENEQNFNARTECRNMELNTLANGQGDVAMEVEQAKNDIHCSTYFENVEGMRVEQSTDVDQVRLHGEEEMEDVTDVDNGDDQIVNFAAPENYIKVHRARYQLPPENEGDFSVSDLVWGKVRSHPWWPGQIFDPSDSSEKAMKYYKKDFFLVAYFGDRTFAWNEVSHLKPFRTHFSDEEIHSNSETFQNAVECALEEVSRRSELGLACACTPREAFDMIQCQIVENAGIREESSRRYGVDNSASAKSFEPAKLIEFIRDLAKFPADGSDRLELVIAKAQLTAFYRLKGYCSLPQFHCGGLSQFQFCGGLVDDDSDTLGIESSGFVQHAAASCQYDAPTVSYQENLKGPSSSYHKRKHNLKDGLYPRKKERSLSELMGETFDNLDSENWSDGRTSTMLASPSGKKRKIADDHTDESKTISSAKVSSTAPLKQSFKIGDCIRRAASQLTGTSPIVKSPKPDGIDGHAGYDPDSFLQCFDDAQRGRVNFPTEYSSLDALLFQLQEVASDPMKEYGFSNVIVSFFADFRDSVSRHHSGIEDLASDKVSGKRKTPFASIVSMPETFEFEDMSDTYWTDRVIQNGTEVQPPRRGRKREHQVALAEPDKSLQGSRRPYKKRNSVGNHALPAEKFTGSVHEPSPAELVMNFSEVDSVPSERTLNSMFRRFGPLRESETEVDREGGRARVVFKKSADAEIAYNSAGRFNIFGPRLVNYQLSYTPTTLFKASPIPRLQDQEMHLDLSTAHFQEMHLDLASFHDHDMQLDLSSIHDQEMQLDLSTIEYQEMDSVLDPHQHQDSKPSYNSSQLGEMQAADFSTIQYERHHDLALTHDQELHTVFGPNHQEAKLVPTASQDQELEHNFTSTQLDHVLTHHDEPHIASSTQGQEMQLIFSTVKVEKTQPALASIQEEPESVLAPIPEQQSQADLAPSHHNRDQTVPATTQEQEMQPVYAMGQEETKPVLEIIQEQEKEAVTDNPIHLEDEHSVPATIQEQEMQPILEEIRVNVMSPVSTSMQDQEMPPPTSSEELVGETIPTKAEGQEAEHVIGTAEGHEMEHVLASTEQATQSDTAITHEQEDTELAVLTGEETQEETQPIVASTQELEIQPDHASAQEELERDLAAIQSHELQPDHVTTEEHEAEADCITSQVQEVRSDHGAGPEQDVLDDNATNEVPETQSDNGTNQEQDMQGCNDANLEHEMQCDNPTNKEEEAESNNITHHDQDTQSDHNPETPTDHAMNEEMQCDNATDKAEEAESHNITRCDLDTQSGHNPEMLTDHAMNEEMQCDNATNKVEEAESHNITHCDLDTQSGHNPEMLTDHAMNEEMQCDNATNKVEEVESHNITQCDLDTQSDHNPETLTDHPMNEEMQCDNATNKAEEAESHNITHCDQDTQSDHKQEMLTDHPMNEEMQCDNATNKEERAQSHNTEGELDMSDHKQEMLTEHAMNHEIQCDNPTNKEEVVQPGNTTCCEQDTQSDLEQEIQTDHAMNKEPETQYNNGTLHEQDTLSDLAEKHTTKDEVIQPDLATFPDAERHPDFVPSMDQEMQLGT